MEYRYIARKIKKSSTLKVSLCIKVGVELMKFSRKCDADATRLFKLKV